MPQTRTVVPANVSTPAPAASAPAQERQGERLSSLLEGRVTFTIPRAWTLESHLSTKTSGQAQLDIPNPPADKSPQRSNAILSVSVVPEGANVRHQSDGVYKNVYEGLAVVGDTFDGDNWRTMVWTVKDVVPYVVLHRFGLTGRVSVELMTTFPVENNDPKWVEQVVADFNAMCASLKIDGQNKFDSPVRTDKLPKPQKVNPKS